MFTSEQITKVITNPTSYNMVLKDVQKNWPLLQKHMTFDDIPAVVGLIATVGVECHFTPVHEKGSPEYFKRLYGTRSDWEVDNSGLWKWRGRGFIQLTGKANYAKYGHLIGIDLLRRPDDALSPEIAAKVCNAYYTDHGCHIWARRGHWLRVRELVNGKWKNRKPNGWDDFSNHVWKLLDLAY